MAINDRFGLGLRNAIAANKAHELNEERKDLKNAQQGEYQGTLEKTVDNLTDALADGVNIATLGIFRRATNWADDKESKIDYENLSKGAKHKTITADSTTDARAKLLTNQSVFQADLGTDESRKAAAKKKAEEEAAKAKEKEAAQKAKKREEPQVDNAAADAQEEMEA